LVYCGFFAKFGRAEVHQSLPLGWHIKIRAHS
jgi:hypothetical protein